MMLSSASNLANLLISPTGSKVFSLGSDEYFGILGAKRTLGVGFLNPWYPVDGPGPGVNLGTIPGKGEGPGKDAALRRDEDPGCNGLGTEVGMG
mmetsp:Transcript_29877/g.28569  ORF Transcript_29877/g.28569 Transcript_29877/m.28569 type:complete len:94 (-) Transcript_29877:199-480(-)